VGVFRGATDALEVAATVADGAAEAGGGTAAGAGEDVGGALTGGATTAVATETAIGGAAAGATVPRPLTSAKIPAAPRTRTNAAPQAMSRMAIGDDCDTAAGCGCGCGCCHTPAFPVVCPVGASAVVKLGIDG
jgi:hypothetical protein